MVAAPASGSSRLRSATASHHQAIDHALGLPASIQTLEDYEAWLARFFALYQPMESTLRGFPQWPEWDIDIAELGMAAALSCDLAALRRDVSLIKPAPQGRLPKLATFPAALGSLYVLEGSKLGGRFILHDLAGRLGAGIAGSDAFFAGNGSQTGSRWSRFQSSLDRFSAGRPGEFDEVVSGAQATFSAVQDWMSPLRCRNRDRDTRSDV
jgi:heme oxygenase